MVAAGGARDLADLTSLRSMTREGRGLGGVVVGREITEGHFTIEQAKEVLGA